MISALRYEWRRLRSLRSTWILSGLAILQAAGFAQLIVVAARAFDENGTLSQAPVKFSELIYFLFIPFFPVLLSAVAAQAFGHDYRHGTIRISLSLFPRRGQILWARVLMLSFFQLVVVSLTIASVIGIIALQDDATGGLSDIGLVDSISKLVAYLMVYLWIVVALSIITRIQALAFVIPMVLSIIVENILSLIAFTNEDWTWISNYLPFSTATQWVTSNLSFVDAINSDGSSPLPILVVLGVLGLWSVISFHKRDA
jgi:ABC-type transport system involved in multi-copper enzyme maturation permease subunit